MDIREVLEHLVKQAPGWSEENRQEALDCVRSLTSYSPEEVQVMRDFLAKVAKEA